MTEQKVHECEFLWNIENFSISLTQDRDFIISPLIVSSLLGGSGWCICLEFQRDVNKDYISIYLRRIQNDEGPTYVDVCFDIGLVDNCGLMCHTKSVSESFLRGDFAGHGRFLEKDEFLRLHSLGRDVVTFKGRIWRPAFSDAFSEKINIRTLLRMKMANFLLKMHPGQSGFEMETDTVKDFKLHCTCVEIPTGKSQLPEIGLELIKETSAWTFVAVKMSIRNKKSELLLEGRSSHRFLPGDSKYWILPSFNDQLQEFHFFNYLDVLLELAVSDGDDESFVDNRMSVIHHHLLRALERNDRHVLANDMERVLFQDVFPDVYIRFGEESLVPAHRVVLSSRSPVLRKLLMDANSKWELSLKALKYMVRKAENVLEKYKESDDQIRLGEAVRRSGAKVSRSGGTFVVEFPDDDERVIKKMVSFIYTDTIHYLDYDTALKLLEAADTYRIKGLKEWSASFLKTCITVKNAQAILIAAKYHGCVALENEVRLFIYENEDFIDYEMKRQMLADTDMKGHLSVSKIL